MIVLSDVLSVFFWLALIFLLHLSLLPLFRRYLPVIAVPLSLSLGVLLFTLVSYWTALFRLPLVFAVFPFLVLIGIALYQGYSRQGSPGNRRWLRFASSEWRYYALFCLVFFSMLLIRLYSPDISSAEKFMDHGFLASIMRSPDIPPPDPWFAGGDLSVYYYLGHWMLAAMGLITGIPSTVLFTLSLPTIAALSAVNLYGTGHLLLSRFRLLPVVFLFLINPAFVFLSMKGTGWGSLLWDSTRVIEATINEYPLFSCIFGDVHAHVLGFLPQTTLILLVTSALICWKGMDSACRILIILATGVALGSVPPINSWDILIQAPLIIITGSILILTSFFRVTGSDRTGIGFSSLSDLLHRLRTERGEPGIYGFFSPLRGAVLYLVTVPVTGLICYLPFYLMLKAQGIGGIGLVTTPSSPDSFLLVNGWFILIIALSLLPVFRKKPWLLLVSLPCILTGYYAAAIGVVLLGALIARHEGPGDLFACAGLAILIFCEILYLKDGMGDQYYRMNTVFKLYLTAWLLFSVAAADLGGRMLIALTGRVSLIRHPAQILIPVVLLLLLLLPGYVTFTQAGPHTPTFDGLAWLSLNHQDDGAAVAWLRSLPDVHTIVEAESGDYGYYSRISAFTGIPTIIGWPFHEMMWRKDTPPGWYGERTSDVRSIYEDPTRTVSLMRKYGADLLYAGPSEMERYDVNLPSSGLKQVYQHGAVSIYGLS